jgi:hypothetical protein
VNAGANANEVQESENGYDHGWGSLAMQWSHENALSDRRNVMNENDHGNESVPPANSAQDTFLWDNGVMAYVVIMPSHCEHSKEVDAKS